MPYRNTRNRTRTNADFHTYNREQHREPMFVDDEDRRMFLWLVRRYLSTVVHTDARGRPYRNLRSHVQLLAFALMGNHFHLVLRQLRTRGLETFMNGVMSSYVRYFNKRHGGSGTLFTERFRAVEKLDRRSRLNAIAYVHDNHGIDCRCEFCSHRFYVGLGDGVPSWIAAEQGIRMFGGTENYLEYRQLRRGLSILAS
jgi:REP element-mobilizing transposase RayT